MPSISFKWKAYLPYGISLTIFLIFAVYLYQNSDKYWALLNVSTELLMLLIGLRLLFSVLNSSVSYIFYHGLGVPISLNESIGLTMVNALANYLPLSGGIVAKSAYLKKKYVFSITHHVSAIFTLYIYFITINGMVGLLVLVYWQFSSHVYISIYLWLGLMAMSLSCIVFFFPTDWISVPPKWKQIFIKIKKGGLFLRQNKTVTFTLAILQCGTILIFSGRMWTCFQMISLDVSFMACMILSTTIILTRLVSIAPAGLGVRESIVAGVATILGFDVGASIIAVTLDRLIATLVVVLLGTVYSYILSHNLTTAEM